MLLDVWLPGDDGFTLLEELAGRSDSPYVVVMTAPDDACHERLAVSRRTGEGPRPGGRPGIVMSAYDIEITAAARHPKPLEMEDRLETVRRLAA